MGGLHYESLSDLPPQMRQQVASKIVAKISVPIHVAGDSGKKASKYRNRKVKANGHTFDSEKEYNRYLQLMDAVREGVIYDLRLQHNFTLVEGYTKPGGERIQPQVYKADFTYRITGIFNIPTGVSFDDLEYWRKAVARHENNGLIIEDVKTQGTRTRTYINKYKLMADHGYTIREV